MTSVEDFVEVKPCAVQGDPDAHTVRFVVGTQQFSLTPFACETREEAEWTKRMFCIALRKMIGGLENV